MGCLEDARSFIAIMWTIHSPVKGDAVVHERSISLLHRYNNHQRRTYVQEEPHFRWQHDLLHFGLSKRGLIMLRRDDLRCCLNCGCAAGMVMNSLEWRNLHTGPQSVLTQQTNWGTRNCDCNLGPSKIPGYCCWVQPLSKWHACSTWVSSQAAGQLWEDEVPM